MLLVELTVNSVKKYISNEWLEVEHFYEGYVASLNGLRISTPSIFGGYAEPSFGSIEILANVFGNQLAPETCHIKVSVTDSNEASAILCAEGTAYLKSIGSSRVVYDIYGAKNETKVTDKTYTGTLVTVFGEICTALSLTLDSTRAQVPSPAIDYEVSGEAFLMDVLSTLAQFNTHRFHIVGTTLYLVDCFADHSTVYLTEFDAFPGEPITTNQPYRTFKAKYTPDIYHYRLDFAEVQVPATTIVSVAEIQIKKAESEDDLTVPGGAATTSTFLGTGYEATKAIDDLANTQWASNNEKPAWWRYDFAYPTVIDSYTVKARDNATYLGQTPVKWDFKAFDIIKNEWRKVGETVETEADWEASTERNFSVGEITWDAIVETPYTFCYDDNEVSQPTHKAYAVVHAALQRIAALHQLRHVVLTVPIGTWVQYGGRVELVTTALPVDSTIWCRVSSITWDFDNEKCTLEGEGGVL